MDAHEHHHHDLNGKRLLLTIILNMVITIAQVIGSIVSGSLALLSDATHNLSDVLALVVSFVANKIAQMPYSEKRTFGYKRIEIIAAIINVTTIMVIAINILIEGVKRFNNPVEVTGTAVILLAVLSIILNGLSVLIIKPDAEHSLNIKSAYVHLFTDMLTSIAVLLGGVIMYFAEIYWIDSVISIGIALYLVYISYNIMLDALKIIMEFAPDKIDLNELKECVEAFDKVESIHHVHLWQITENEIRLEAHLVFKENITVEEATNIIGDIKIKLDDEFGISECMIESEYGSCGDEFIVDER
ncbi:MAG: cation transporter [Peptostreptococcaceae bacterium]|nr:cation transporter [Peptostreptococcaceae bacterium]